MPSKRVKDLAEKIANESYGEMCKVNNACGHDLACCTLDPLVKKATEILTADEEAIHAHAKELMPTILRQLRDMIVDIKIRVIYVGHPKEPRNGDGQPDWSVALQELDLMLAKIDNYNRGRAVENGT